MAGADRAQAGAVDLFEQLRNAPHEFDFFQALRRLECAHRGSPRLGESLRPEDDVLRFSQEASLAFANCTLSSFSPGKNGRPWRLSTNFFGFLGPNGPLPIHLTEYARDRTRNAGDPTFVRFLDLFLHRLLSLFYRARAMAEPTFQFDRPETDRFRLYIGALCGYGAAPLHDRDELPDLGKLHFAGHFGCAAKSALRLQSILSELLGVPAIVDEFVAHWMLLPDDCRCQLGTTPWYGTHSAGAPSAGTLGVSAILGDRVSDCQHKFRIVLGPMDADEFEELLPGGRLLPFVISVVRNFIGDELSWDLRLVLKRKHVKPVELGRTGRLGWTTWIGDYPAGRDSGDLTLDAANSARRNSATSSATTSATMKN
jgi:type VI secretion system protein ImpH